MRKLSFFAIVLGLAACRDTSGGDDTPGVDSNTNSDVTIQEIQNDAMPSGTPVTVKGVVVTAIDTYGGKTGDFWVQEPSGGPYSGVHVYGAPVDQVAALALGDVVDISGAEKDDFMYSSFPAGYAITELKPVMGGNMTVTKVSSGTPLAPQVVDALAIGQMADYMARDAEWEKWEGVLVTVSNVSAFSATQCITSMGNCNDPTYESFGITGDIKVQSSLAAMPSPKVARDDCLASVAGVVDYFFDYQILPRTTAEIGTGGTGCATENQMTACGDGIDNDGNGFSDCNDNQCILASATCRTVTTINAIQTTATPPTGGVELQNVYVAAISKNKRNLWVQTSLTAAPNEGIYVYGPGSDLSSFAVGTKVNVIGTVEEFNDMTGTETLTELKALSVTAGTGSGTVVAVTGVNASAMAESYESVLVTLASVKVTTLGVPCTGGAVPPACNYGVGVANQGTGTATVIKTDDDINVLGPVGTCYASVTGIWTYLPYEDSYGFLPLTTTGTGGGAGTCP